MGNKYMCMRCHASGAKSLIPYKIIEDKTGDSVRFVGQLCEKCYKEIFVLKNEPAPASDKQEPDNKSEVSNNESDGTN